MSIPEAASPKYFYVRLRSQPMTHEPHVRLVAEAS
jgi:hypothetical protein